MHRPTSPSSSFFNHGLHGIDLHHATQRRDQQIREAQQASNEPVTLANPVRRQLGDLLIALGRAIGGTRTPRPGTARFV